MCLHSENWQNVAWAVEKALSEQEIMDLDLSGMFSLAGDLMVLQQELPIDVSAR